MSIYGIITKNLCNKHSKPKESDFIDFNNSKENVKFLTDDEINHFYKKAVRPYENRKPVYRLDYAFIFILNTGSRLGEELALIVLCFKFTYIMIIASRGMGRGKDVDNLKVFF